eukprot:CAMPEP_0170576044 /NCGR_PEP_ID=MMETSP0224-20130122/4183_1 /TAXON_ID=285029 /ORGANISM="Togula jolla, Strain CCCM 725" /LENGTH=313 /DNA_ID=CAMNT_0010898861 /DNA_START=105 /DNA_END=1046 /DNA_ORIENTATION=+
MTWKKSDPTEMMMVKLYRLDSMIGPPAAVRHEVRIWSKVGDHPNCLRLIDIFHEKKQLFVIFERWNVSLLERMERISLLPEVGLACLFRGMLLSLQHIHSQGIVHRDVVPDSFVFGGHGGGVVKLSNFRQAALLQPGKTMKEQRGTPTYRSPEMLLGTGYSHTTDIWSLGVTAYLLLSGKFPYPQLELHEEASARTSCREAYALRCKPAPHPMAAAGKGSISHEVVLVLMALLEVSSAHRRTATDCLDLPLLRKAEGFDTLADEGLVQAIHSEKLLFDAGARHGALGPIDESFENDGDGLLKLTLTDRCHMML